MAGRATEQAHAAQLTPGRGLISGRAPLVPMREVAVAGRDAAPSKSMQRAFAFGRVGVWAIPVLAILAAIGLSDSDAFSTNPVAYAHFLATKWSSPMAIAMTIATGIFALIALTGLTALLASSRSRWLAVAGCVAGVAGTVMMMIEVGSVVVRAQGVAKPILNGHLSEALITARAHGTSAAILVFGGAALLTLGWILLGLAVMMTSGLNRGDGGLLAVSAPMVYLGGFFLHVLPTMGAFLLGAAGLGIIFTAGRISPDRVRPPMIRVPRVPAPAPSAFARFTDDDLESRYPPEVADRSGDESPAESPSSADDEAIHRADPRPHDPQHAAASATHAAASAAGFHEAPTVSGNDGAHAGKRKRSLGSLSRGISTAWQVNRASRKPDAAKGASGPSGAKNAKDAAGSGSKWPLNGAVNGTASANGKTSPNGTAPVNGAAAATASANGAAPANDAAGRIGKGSAPSSKSKIKGGNSKKAANTGAAATNTSPSSATSAEDRGRMKNRRARKAGSATSEGSGSPSARE